MSESKYNKLAYDPDKRAITEAWTKKKSPLAYVYAPSNTGKTTWLGTIFPYVAKLSLPPVLYIDGDQGDSTIEEFTSDPRLCTLRTFEDEPEKQYGWMLQQLKEARNGNYSAIIIEGFSSIMDSMVAAARAKLPAAEGTPLMRASIDPTMRMATLIEHTKIIKQSRIARGTGLLIVAALNTKMIRTKPNDLTSPQQAVPDWSENLSNKAMRKTDAFLELTRPTEDEMRLLTKKSSDNPFRKVRKAAAADAIQKQTNLTIPGMTTCWAMAIHNQAQGVSAGLDKRDAKSPRPRRPPPTQTQEPT